MNHPPHLQFGIDNQQWQTGDLFKGLKLIPPGAHYIHYALPDEDYANKMGFFIHITERPTPDSQDVIVRQWNAKDQVFEKVSEADQMAYTEAVRNMDFDRNLGAYPMENHQQW